MVDLDFLLVWLKMRFRDSVWIGLLIAMTALSSSSVGSEPLRFAATEMPKPDPCLPFITETRDWLDKHWADGVTFKYYTVKALEEAVKNREVDIVLSEAGTAALLRRDGARPMLTTVSRRHPNPERSQGSVIFVRKDNKALQTWSDLRHKTLAATSSNDFTGYQAAMGELLHRGFKPEGFFSDITFAGNTSKLAQQAVVDRVLRGEADVGIVRTCFLEDLTNARQSEIPVRVIEPYPDKAFACQRSTALYPNWTISTVPTLSADELRVVMETLFAMPPTSNGMFWSVAPDFSATDTLMKELRIGPYEFLRTWTINRLWAEYKWPIGLFALFFIGLLIHMRRTEQLVARRTQELTQAFEREATLKSEAQAKDAVLEHYQRASIAGQISNLFAHEIKQPLHSAQCYSHGLLRMIDRGETDSPAFREALEKIKAETASAGQIVDKVRNYAKGRSSQSEAIVLPALLHDILEHETAKRGITYTWQDETPTGVEVYADPLEMKLIFVNLIKNACEAALGGKNNPKVMVRLSADKDRWLITIQDTGPAVDDETYVKLDVPLTTTKPDGLGFGLVIVRGLLANMGGALQLSRQASGGLEALVTIPRSTAPQKSTSPTE